MLPILFSLGPIKIYSFGVLLFIGLFLGLYYFWKLGRDEHFDEIELFDAYFLGGIVFLIAGRLGYVALHMETLGTLYRTLAILAFPGVSGVVGIVAATIFVVLFARSHDWHVWKVMDLYCVSLSLIIVFASIGALLNGTNPSWQASTWLIVWSILTFGIVARVRKNFRFYGWYKGESSIAQEGLATLVHGTLIGFYYLIAGLFGQTWWQVGIPVILICGYLIEKRVGRREHSIWGKLKLIIRRK